MGISSRRRLSCGRGDSMTTVTSGNPSTAGSNAKRDGRRSHFLPEPTSRPQITRTVAYPAPSACARGRALLIEWDRLPRRALVPSPVVRDVREIRAVRRHGVDVSLAHEQELGPVG